MEVGKAPAIRFEPVLEVGPAADFVNRLVDHKLFEKRRGRIPGDLPDFEKALVEPVREQAAQIMLERVEGLAVMRELHQLGPHSDEKLDAARQGVELGQKTEPRRLERLAQSALDA